MFDSDENPIEMLFRLMIAAMIEVLPIDLPALLIARFGNADQWTPDYITRFCIGVYLTSISLPHHMLKVAGLFKVVKMLLDSDERDSFSPEKMLKNFQRGFGEYSPTFAGALNTETLVLTAKLLALDWLKAGDMPDDEDEAKHDTHIYFQAAMEYLGVTPDHEKTQDEAAEFLANASPDELENLPPEAVELVRRKQEQRRNKRQ